MKTKNLFLTAIAILGLATANMAQNVPSYVPTDGLVGWWPFNGNANDESGNGNNGDHYIFDGVTFILDPNQFNNYDNDRFGNSSAALKTSVYASNVMLPVENNFFQSDFTIGLWAKNDSIISQYPTILQSDNNHLTMQYGNTGGPIRFGAYFTENGIPPFGEVGAVVKPNEWVFITLVNINFKNQLYFNGVLVDSTSDFNVSQAQSFWNNIRVGNSMQLPQGAFYGLVDDIGIWNRALTPEEVKALYKGDNQYTCDLDSILNPNLFYGSVVDIDGNVYPTIQIGSQNWMAENLKCNRFQNGDLIPNITDQEEWNNLLTPASVYYNNDNAFSCPYGRLYNWYAAADSRNVCPTGWHVPSLEEFEILNAYLGDGGLAGIRLRSLKFSSTFYNETNESGFSAMPSGAYYIVGFAQLNYAIGLWTNQESYPRHAFYKYLAGFYSPFITNGDQNKLVGLSIRCMQDYNGNASLPIVLNLSVNNVTDKSAELSSSVSSDGGSPVSVRGFVWSKMPNPNLGTSNKILKGEGIGDITSFLLDLEPLTTYYVKAFAVNVAGIAYSNEVEFTTLACELIGNILPLNPDVEIGEQVTFDGQVITSEGTSFKWQANTASTGWSDIHPSSIAYSGQNSAQLIVKNVTLSNHMQEIRLIANNGSCADTSNVSTIFIKDTCLVTLYDTIFTTITDTSYIAVTDTLLIDILLSTQPNPLSNLIRVYPNPTSTHLIIDAGQYTLMTGYTLTVTSETGALVWTQSVSEPIYTLDLSVWGGKGLYFITLKDPQGNVITTRKIVIL